MQTYQEENDSKILVILLSILLHLGLLFAFLFINEYDITYKKMLEKLKEKQEEAWAETKPAASNFGAPVIFEDIPEPFQPPPSSSHSLPSGKPVGSKPEEKSMQEGVNLIAENESLSPDIPEGSAQHELEGPSAEEVANTLRPFDTTQGRLLRQQYYEGPLVLSESKNQGNREEEETEQLKIEEVANNKAEQVEDLAQNSPIYQAAQKTLDQVRQHARHAGLTQKTMTTMVSGQSLASAVRGAKRKLDHEMKRLEESMKKLEKYAQRQKQKTLQVRSAQASLPSGRSVGGVLPVRPEGSAQHELEGAQPTPAMPQKKKLTLADLAKGFLTHLKNEGQHAVKMYGKKGAKVTQEQLKLERYVQKIVWQLENSMRINRDRLKIRRELETELYIYLALNRNGTLKELKLAKSSGIREIDNFYMFIFKDASTSFPPVPSYLPGNPLKLNFHAPINTYRSKFSFSY